MAMVVTAYRATSITRQFAVIINKKSIRILQRISAFAYTKDNVNNSSSSGAQFFEVSGHRGFLPAVDPLLHLSHPQFTPWEESLHDLPKLLSAFDHGQKLRQTIEKLPPFPYQQLLGGGDPEIWRGMLVLAFIAHAYIWGAPSPVSVLPSKLAVPFCKVSSSLGMPPVLTYATYALLNWRILDKNSAIELGNIVCLHNFYGGLDEEWFRLFHVDIEAKASVGLRAVVDAHDAVARQDVAQVHSSLTKMADTLKIMQKTLCRMGEKCDPHIYYHRIRKFMSGCRGAQSSIVPAFDAALGVTHVYGSLSDYLQVMRLHMPLSHRSYIQQIENGPSIRLFVIAHMLELGECYDACLTELFRFRALHMKYASAYITQPGNKISKRGKRNWGNRFYSLLASKCNNYKRTSYQCK